MKRVRLACDFCGKTQDEIETLIMGPRDIGICNECVDLCVVVLSGEVKPVMSEEATSGGGNG